MNWHLKCPDGGSPLAKYLAKGVGVQFQQMQKYEDGVNRTSGSRLVMIAEALDVPISALFGKYGDAQMHDGL